MTLDLPDDLVLTYLAAERAHLATHPAPRAATEFACRRCGAEPGDRCAWGRRSVPGRPFHVDRLDAWIGAARSRFEAAATAGMAAVAAELSGVAL